MKTKTRRRSIAAAVVLAIVALGVLAWIRRTPTPPGVPPGMVPASWAEYRTSLGHDAHIGVKNVVCKDCHAYEEGGFKAPKVDVCTRCHEKQANHSHGGLAGMPEGKHAAASDLARGACLDCHPFAPRKAMPTCISCHDKAQDHVNAIGTHAKAECKDCHAAHTDAPMAPKDCTGCHDERATKHAAHDASKGCSDCHAPHQPKTAALPTCAGCHEDKASRPHPEKHECLGCHKPHEFTAGGAAVCQSCHANKPVLAAAKVPSHANCLGCHDQHSPGGAAASCVNCHVGVAVKHGGGGACTSCHTVHKPPAGGKLAVACTSCHSKVAVADVAHAAGTPCTTCHQKHSFSPPPAGPARVGFCSGCHAKENNLVAIATKPEHKDCNRCHGDHIAHAPTQGTACPTCHTAEASTAPGSSVPGALTGHQKCLGCHENHSTRVQTTCINCHAQKATGPHKNVQGGCDTCHRPHGPNGPASPPACATCHTKPTLPALHQSSGHATCASCHQSHAPPKADRATCTTTCHKDRANHQPGVQTCNGCHVFQR